MVDRVRASAPPLVSVVTAVLDRVSTIDATLDSVARQTRAADLEHIVVDGGSTDGTLERVLARGPGVRLVSGRDHGIFDGFNRGLGVARGEWVAFLNSDDVWVDDGVVERVLAAAAAYPEAEILHGDLDFVDAAGAVTGSLRFVPVPGPDPYVDLAWMPAVFHPASFMRRALVERLGGFDATWRIAADYELFARAWRAGARFVHLPEVMTLMRDDGVSARRPFLRGLEVFRVSRRLTGGLAGPLLELLRAQTVTLLEDRARHLLTGIRRVKHLFRGPRTTGALVSRAARRA